MSTIRQELNLFCKECGHVTVNPLPFDMKIPHDCERCGANITSPPTEEEMEKRLAAMHDSRILNWHKLESPNLPPVEGSYLVAVKTKHNIWYFKRCDGRSNHIIWCGDNYGLAATHWLPDLLGLPFDGKAC